MKIYNKISLFLFGTKLIYKTKKMNKIEITQENGYFLINKKKYIDCDPQEQRFFNDFIIQNQELINRILYEKPKDVEILK